MSRAEKVKIIQELIYPVIAFDQHAGWLKAKLMKKDLASVKKIANEIRNCTAIEAVELINAEIGDSQA